MITATKEACTDCGRECVIALSVSGSKMLLDDTPACYFIARHNNSGRPVASRLPNAYVNHHAVCPKRKECV